MENMSIDQALDVVDNEVLEAEQYSAESADFGPAFEISRHYVLPDTS